MKKIYTLFVFLSPLLALSQPTITQNGMPVAGLGYVMGTNYDTLAAPAGGANQTWNFATIQNAGNDTNGFVSAAGTLYSGTYPGANLSNYNVANDIWTYFTSDSTGFYINGIAGSGTPTGTPITFNPPQLYAPVPFSYNDMRNNNSRIVIDTVVLSYNAQFVINTEDDFVADAWGTLVLPSGTYNNVLRLKVTEVVWDSAYYDLLGNGTYTPVPTIFFTPTVSQSVFYRWVQDQQPGYIMGMDADSLGDTVTYTEYLESYAILSVNNIQTSPAQLHAFPNPASSSVTILAPDAESGTLIVRNLLGQEIESKQVSNEQRIHLDTEKYDDGVYDFTFITKSGRRNGRFVIRH